MSTWLNNISVVFSKNDRTPVTNEDIDYIYEHLDRDCLVMQNPFQKHEAFLRQENTTWSHWKEDLQKFCENTEGYTVSAHTLDEYGNRDTFCKKSSGKARIAQDTNPGLVRNAEAQGTTAQLDAYLRSKLQEVNDLGYMDNFHMGFKECLLTIAEEFLKTNLR